MVIAFFYGYPQPSHDDANVMAWGKDPTVAARKAKYLRRSRIGLGLMALGFMLQLVATWVARIV